MELGRYWWWPVVLVLVHFGMNGCFGCWEQERIALLQYKASTYLDLSWNYIPGWVPNEGTKFYILRKVGGFKRFSALSKLELLHLDGNSFNNSILSSLSGIASLKELYLGSNNLNGSIPIQDFERFSLLSKLEVLHLDYNNFNNSVLQYFSGIASLKQLDLSYNNLNGSIHIQEFKAFSNMEELYLNANEIKDFVTTNDSNILSKLQLLDLSETKISIRILESSAAFPSLRTLYLTYNNLKGSFTTKGKFMPSTSSWWYFALFFLSLA
ncbi:receptor-like protein 15 [Quercus suber]|uniref:Receptor-like protein 15 n=1 Tax=Quercus suber TaxID=58331 RepID=A0AAW0LY22_QUESU